jgi:hypothetical protein
VEEKRVYLIVDFEREIYYGGLHPKFNNCDRPTQTEDGYNGIIIIVVVTMFIAEEPNEVVHELWYQQILLV